MWLAVGGNDGLIDIDSCWLFTRPCDTMALEIEFLKGALKHGPRPRSATTSVVTGPAASLSQKDAG